jgi:ribose transport system substrate-binding protein
VAFDATKVSIEDLKSGINDIVIAQKPWLMGKLGVDLAVSYLEGKKDFPTNIATGFGVITRDNVDDPKIQALIY